VAHFLKRGEVSQTLKKEVPWRERVNGSRSARGGDEGEPGAPGRELNKDRHDVMTLPLGSLRVIDIKHRTRELTGEGGQVIRGTSKENCERRGGGKKIHSEKTPRLPRVPWCPKHHRGGVGFFHKSGGGSKPGPGAGER